MAASQALVFSSAFGHSWDLPGGVVSLSTQDRGAVCYVAGHTAIIYETGTKEQIPLQGHQHALRCLAVSSDKRALATADVGEGALLVIWNAVTGKPLWTAPQGRSNGIVAMDFSAEGRYLATLSNTAADVSQEVSIWDLQNPEDGPILITPAPEGSLLTSLRFNPESHRELVTNSGDRVVFWQQVVHEDTSESLQAYRPSMSLSALKPSAVSLTISLFVPGTTTVVTGTSDGGLIVWEEERREGAQGESAFVERRPIKNVRIHTAAITALTTVGKYLVSGGADGYVRFFDSRLRLAAWFEEMYAGGITSVSFSSVTPVPLADDAFCVPDFVVGTRQAKILIMEAAVFEDQPKSARRAGELILAGNYQAVASISAHPSQPHVTLIGDGGLQQVYDYASRTVVVEKKHNGLQASAVCYSARGDLIAAGFSNGSIQIQNSTSLEELFPFRTTTSAITHLAFSPSLSALAAADASYCVSLITYGHGKAGDKWEAIGKVRAHNDVITGLHFASRADGQACLVSCAEDGCIVEYNLESATPGEGLRIKNASTIKSTGVPTSLAFIPGRGGRPELLISDDAFKLKSYDIDERVCRNTWAGPVLGEPINKVVPFTSCQTEQPYLAYATKTRVAGLMKLPLTGDPNRAMGLIAQPGEVTCLAVGYDGETLVTAGGPDGILTFWRIDAPSLDAQAAANPEPPGVAERMDGGREGDAYRDAKDFFLCYQIRSQEAGSRHVTDTIPADRLQELSSALEFYPSQGEAEEMAEEARGESDGNPPGEIALERYLEVLEQHRPVEGLDESQLERAFQELGADPTTGQLSRDKLLQLLMEEGEPLTREELDACLSTISGQPTSADGLPDELGVREFATYALGFEDPRQEIEAV